jgi:hypothetical protein
MVIQEGLGRRCLLGFQVKRSNMEKPAGGAVGGQKWEVEEGLRPASDHAGSGRSAEKAAWSDQEESSNLKMRPEED